MSVVVQSSYTANQAVGLPGQPADMIRYDAVSRRVEDATLAYGVAVIQGTAADQVKVGAAGNFIGITVKDITLTPEVDNYVQTETAAVMIRGSMWVTVSGNVTAGAAVYRTATGTLNATSAENTLVANAIWETTASSGALARIRLA